MVMDEPQGVAEYDQAGATVQLPIHYCNALALSNLLPEGNGILLDLGCGSARLLMRLAKARPDTRLIGLDLSGPMLETGRRLIAQEGLTERVELRAGDITDPDIEIPAGVSVVSCCFALHQFPSEELAVRCLEAIRRIRQRTGCGVYVFDFARLRHPRSWPAMMSVVEVPGTVFLYDAIASERAAFTLTELTSLLRRAGLRDLQHARAGPLGEYQLHWAPAQHARPPGRWYDVPFPRGTRLATHILRQSFPHNLVRGTRDRGFWRESGRWV
jgi:ubiquinone/menaquinone biosynthesis C-methylase UbiE